VGKQQTKRHHVVPQFYLRRFADKSETIAVVDRDDPTKRFKTSVRNAAVEGWFYGIPTEEGWDTIIEDTLATLEGIASHDIPRLAEGRSSTLDAFRKRLSFFMAVQFVRGRGPRQAMIDFQKEIFKKTLQLSTPQMFQAQSARHGESITIEQARELAAMGQDPTLQVEFQRIGPRQLPADSLVNAADVFKQGEKLIRFFYMRKWMLADFGAPLLLTSDEPVATGVDMTDPQRSAGLANADSIVFPLDPQRALIMMRPDFQAPAHRWVKGTAQEAKAINQLVSFRGMRQIFHHPDTDPLADLEIPGSPNHPAT
jgi:hypothetical protein